MAHFTIATVAIAALLRVIVPILRSPLMKGVWTKLPKWLRPIVLCGIALILGIADSLALGTPMPQALLSGLSALGVAVTSYETGKGVKLPKAPKELKK